MKRMRLRFNETRRPKRSLKIGGFNLMPYRQRDARRERRRRALEWLAAALAGSAAVLTLAAWHAIERARLDAQRSALERTLAQLAGPLAEHARLTRELEEARVHTARAAVLSEPLGHLVGLFDELSRMPAEDVIVQQLRHRSERTELLAASHGHAASAAWLKRLNALPGVQGADLSELHRANLSVESLPWPQAEAVEFAAHLQWSDTRGKLTRPSASVGPVSVKPASIASASARPATREAGSVRGVQ
jgi:hypothetical protein